MARIYIRFLQETIYVYIYIFIRLFFTRISNSIYSYNSLKNDYLQYNLTSIIYLNRVYIFQLFFPLQVFPRDGSRGISFKKRRQRVSIFHHQRSISRRINPHQNRLYLLSFSSSRHESRGVVTWAREKGNRISAVEKKRLKKRRDFLLISTRKKISFTFSGSS